MAELTSDRPMKHGEQLAPLIEQALHQAGIARQDLTAIAVGVGPGPFTGLRVGLVTARTLGYVLEIPVYGVCSLDVLAVEAVETGAVTRGVPGGDRRAPQGGLLGALRRRRGARLTGPVVDKPAGPRNRRPRGRGGRRALPRGLPPPHRTGRAQRRLAGPRRDRGRAELLDPEPLYLRRPDAVRPASPSASRDPRGRTPDDVPAIAGLERDNLGADAWSEGLVGEGVRGLLPTVHYLVAEVDGDVVGYAAASIVADIAELQRIAVDSGHRRTGLATGLLEAVTEARPPRRGGPPAARGPRGQRGRPGVLRGRGLQRDRPAQPLLRRRDHGGRPAADPGPRGAGRDAGPPLPAPHGSDDRPLGTMPP